MHFSLHPIHSDNQYDKRLLSAMVLSESRRYQDVYLAYCPKNDKANAPMLGEGRMFDEKRLFDEELERLVALKWIRVSQHESRGESFLYFTAEGWCITIQACFSQLYYASYVKLQGVMDALGAHYARFYASWFHPYLLNSVNDDLIEQSVNDNFYLISQSASLWQQAQNTEIKAAAKPYFISTWLPLMLGSSAPALITHIRQIKLTQQYSTLPVSLAVDAHLYDPKSSSLRFLTQPIDGSYLQKRKSLSSHFSSDKLSLMRVIDLFLLQHIDMRHFEQALSEFPDLDRQGALPWSKALRYLQMDNHALYELFENVEVWTRSVIDEQGVLWGQLALDLLQMHRLRDDSQFQGIAESLQSSELVATILASPEQGVIASFVKQLIGDLLSGSNLSPRFLTIPDPWSLWIDEVGATLAGEVQQEERFVWVTDGYELSAKIQKKGKKGWSQGRKVEVHQGAYQFSELLTVDDEMLIHYLRSRPHYWRSPTPLEPMSVQLLAKCPHVLDESGDGITIVEESQLLVMQDQAGKLQLTRYPEERTENAALVPRTQGIYSYLNAPPHLERFFELAKRAPEVPASYADHLIAALGSHVDWYHLDKQQGSITLGEWDSQVHVWLHLTNASLEVSLAHQSVDGQCRVVSGQGTHWYQGVGKIWYQRDLNQEKKAVRKVAKALGWSGAYDVPMVLSASEVSPFLGRLSKLDSVVIHWHESSKKVKRITSQDVEVAISAKDKWFSVSADVDIDGGTVLDLQRLLTASRTGYIELKQDNVLVMIDEALRKQLSLLDSMLDDELSVNAKMAYPLAQLVESMSVASDQGWQALEQQWRQPIDIDSSRLDMLRDYQDKAVRWAIHLLSNGFGACLADDMGLGKTVQALKVAEHFSDQGPILVVCPKSVLLNWRQETERFASGLTVVDVEQCPDRQQAITDAKAGDVVLLGYGLVTKLAETLQKKQWQIAILDEAQQIKNPNAQRAKVLVELEAQRRLTLSGTPVENHLVELWSQFAFLNPGLLGGLKQFKAKYGHASKNEEDMLRLKALVSPFVLRRMKKEVLTELPEKTELVHQVELSKKERSAYEAVRRDSLQQAEGEEGSTMQLFAALTRLRQVCCDPHLVFDSVTETSSKLKAALELVHEALEGGHRILIFSQFVQLLKRFSLLLESQSIGYSYLDGQSSTKMRSRNIEAFKSGDNPLFLISLKAGGTGLNLTEADTVIHLDPWWNPAVEDQASDRVYRMGQTNPVTIYRLVATETIEEKIIQLHHDKRDLADKVLAGQNQAQQLSPSVLLELMKA